ncbi:MAG: CARDB domain-containing protein [Candidatus Thorarchaeota archaeon]
MSAIISYVEAGHGFVATSTTLMYSPDVLAPFLGVQESLVYYEDQVISMDILDPMHPVAQGITDPYTPGYNYISFHPSVSGWDGSVLDGADFLALDSSSSNYGAILTYRGMVYFSNVPPLLSNMEDMQIFYNALIWSDYVIPEHDLSARLNTLDRAEPGDTIYVDATVLNQGLQDETDVMLRLFIDGIEVDNLAIPTLTHGTSQTLTYIWTPFAEKIYNVTVFVDYEPDEYSYGNNRATTMVNIRPIQGYILWDESHDNYPLLLHSSYLADLEFEGYVVDTHTSGPITSAVLSTYDILVCAEFYIAYSSSELIDIQNFVMDGGGLLVMGDNDYSLRNALTSYAGIEWTGGSFSGIAFDITPHPVTEGVSEVFMGGAVNVLSTSGSAVSLVRYAGYDLIAASEYGFGYIVAICDDHCLPDGYYETADNPILAVNIMEWMSVGRVDHDVAAILDVPKWVQPEEEVILYASVFNRGLNDEIDITLYLYIDEVLVDSLYVPFIDNGTSETLAYAWTPLTEALYNVTAVVSEVPDENITRNNIATCFVNVFDLHNYYMVEGPATWYDAKANGFNLGIYGDDGYEVFDLNFTFQFYESTFDRVYISTNGWLSFANTQPYDLSGPDFPSADPAFAYCIALYLADLIAEGNIYAWITPDFVVIQYDNYRWLGGEDLGTFQVVFHSEGLIEINYLEMYATPWGTGGLNHGNGIFGNAYPVTTLSGVTDLGVRYYYEPPTHEISLGLNVPTLVDVGDSPTISSTISNNGLNNETDVHYILYIDSVIVDEEIIPELLTGQTTSFDYIWSTPSQGIYNITAYVEPVVNETMISNNRAEREVAVVELTLLTDFESESHGFTPDGLWHRVDDSDPFGNSHSPTHSMWYGQDSTGDYNTGDSNWGTLTSRPILLGSDAMALNFWSWYETEESGHMYDIKDVYLILPDNGWYFLGYVSGTMNTWTEYTFDISDFRDTVVRIAFYFDTLDGAMNDYRGWYVDDISIIGTATPLDHDLQVVVEAPPEAAIGSSYEITATVTNWGTESEFTVDFRLYLDGVVVDSAMIASLDSLESYTLTYWWTPDSMDIYNFTAYAVPEPSEIIVENNVDTKLCNVGGLRQFSIIEPTDGSTVDGGLIYVAFSWNATESPQIISVFVNSVFLTQIVYMGSNDLFVPVFQNGTNIIELQVQWSDMVITGTSVTIESEDVVPVIKPIVGDEANYRIVQPGYLFDYNFTFVGLASPFVWYIVIELAQIDPGTGSIISVTNASISVNILNGYIVDGGMTGWTGMHLFWISGIDAPMPMQSFAGIGDHGIWFYWNEVYTIVDNSTWNGHPTWILDSMLTNFVLEVLAPNGLLVSLEDAAAGLQLFLTYSSFVPEVDTTPPEWVVVPCDCISECGDSFEYQLQATDNLNYLMWSVNDTAHFEIGDDGLLCSAEFLPVGLYPLEVTVCDCYFNSISAIFVVEVVDTRAPTWLVVPSDANLEFGQILSIQLHATDPSGIWSWSLNDTVNFEVSPTGLVTTTTVLSVGVYPIQVHVIDWYMNCVNASFVVRVADTHAPTWSVIPSDVTLQLGQNLSIQLQASDLSGIAGWSINDTANFEVSSTGLVTNTVALSAGTYGLTVTVVDPYGNEASVSFTVTVEGGPSGPIPPDLIIIVAIVIIGAVGVIVIFALIRGVLSRRGGG